MEARELRIGNLVKSNIEGCRRIHFGIVQIDQTSMYYLCDTDDFERLEPIPLTEEWLFKFGFKFDGHCSWWKNELIELTIDTGEDEYSVFNDNGDYITLKGIKYVHQLQNLYFAIKGEELTIKTIDQ